MYFARLVQFFNFVEREDGTLDSAKLVQLRNPWGAFPVRDSRRGMRLGSGEWTGAYSDHDAATGASYAYGVARETRASEVRVGSVAASRGGRART